MVIFGEDYQASVKLAGVSFIPMYAYVLLGLGPIGQTIGQILMRKMIKFNELTISCWSNLT